jgi:ATP-dependent Lhr-like helicase
MNHVPNEFFPHHGSLSKELREDLEARLQKEQLPTSAVCTMTLELGIDIGHVDSVAQVTSPHSVASLRQRLGRSGRRDEAAVLRLFIPESELTKNSHIVDRLRVHLIQSIAMVNLLLNKWYEPPGTDRYHFSTLVQQTLSTLAQYGGVRAQQLWQLLCSTGPFYLVDSAQYAELLRGLGEADMITQTQDGQIVLGKTGEQYVEHYTFYAAFNTPEEYVLEADGKVLGSLPVDKPLMVGQTIIFGGKRWQVRHINDERKRILLTSSPSGSPPSFGGEGMSIHRIIREEMFRVYTQSEFPGYLDSEAKSLLQEAFDTFKELSINKHPIIQLGNTTHLLTWLGDTEINTLVHLLRQSGLDADSYGGVIDVERRSKEDVLSAFQSIISNPPPLQNH